MKLQEKVKIYLDKIKKENKKINAFLYVNDNVMKEAEEIERKGKKGRLYGYVFGVKSNINVKGMPISCASRSLEDYYGAYDAAVIEKIKKEDGLIMGICNCDEFACGVSGERSAFGSTENPIAKGKIPGGSSSGSAAAVAAGFCDAALGSDTGGSVRNPASHCGVFGMKPSYGAVSRYGLIDLSMSLDQIGVLAKNIEDTTKIFEVIKGKDERDTMSIDIDSYDKKIDKLKVGVVKVGGVDKSIEKLVEKRIKEIERKYKWKFEDIEIKHIDLAVETYVPIVFSEFFSATRRVDGRKYGKKIEENSGEEILRRILGGSEITKAEFEGAYYFRALGVKEVIKEEFDQVFEKFDCLVLPTVPTLPWNLGDGDKMKVEDFYAADALTIPMNLAGICAVSVPAGEIDGIPVGMQVVCNKGEDFKMLKIAGIVEKVS